jgi:hypothetical protein
MPLLRFDILKGRTTAEIKTLLDAAHCAVLIAFEVPVRDRYQIVHEHDPSHFVAEDTGLGIQRSASLVLVSVTSRPRTEAAKQIFYEVLCQKLKTNCGIESTDVIVSFTINEDVDWSFGMGRAQFKTGEL